MSEGLASVVARVSGFLVACGHPYAVIGGTAIVARVRVRPTQDVDVVISISTDELEPLLALAVTHGFGFDPADRELMEAGLVRLWVTPREAGAGVDLIFSDSPFLENVISRATPVDLGPATIAIASIEDLLLLKLEANRPIDLDDAIAIKDAHGKTLDRAYLEATADTLGVRRAVENLLGPRAS